MSDQQTPSPKPDWTAYGLVVMLSLCCLGLAYQHWKNASKVQAAYKAETRLQDGHPLKLPASLAQFPEDKLAALYFVFSLDACPYCLDEIAVINEMFDEYGNAVAVQGIALTSDQAALRAFAEKWQIRFPITADVSSTWAVLGLMHNPYKIVVNHTGRILYLAGPFPESESHAATKTHLAALLGEISGTPQHMEAPR